MSSTYNEGTRELTIKAGHKIPVSCSCRGTLVQRIARDDHVMSSHDTFTCLACGSVTSSLDVGPVWYPPTREVL